MTTKLTVRRVGNSMGVTLSKELLGKLHVSEGDILFATETPHGIVLSPYDPSFAEAMAAYGQGASEYRNALHQLAQ
ncbi:MAG: AbrB/MazE/SpoVT family DNA-binding domain-containing protein [Acaryochloris sp. RU_4_1]|nr:AbrB/MazE/SpoVT family DNA-binding domain-containing protein [Acaryochloris sp. RU_4_1]